LPADDQYLGGSTAARVLRALLCLAAVVSAVVVLVGGITKTSRSLDVLTSAATRRTSRIESKHFQCLEAAMRRAVPRGSKVFDASTTPMFYQRVAEEMTPGYVFVQDAAHAQYVVRVKVGTTCKPFAVGVTRGGAG
jgi:hypothetical protein